MSPTWPIIEQAAKTQAPSCEWPCDRAGECSAAGPAAKLQGPAELTPNRQATGMSMSLMPVGSRARMAHAPRRSFAAPPRDRDDHARRARWPSPPHYAYRSAGPAGRMARRTGCGARIGRPTVSTMDQWLRLERSGASRAVCCCFRWAIERPYFWPPARGGFYTAY